MGLKEKVEEIKDKLSEKYSPRQLKALITRRIQSVSKNGGFKGYQLKAIAYAYSGCIKRLGLQEVSKEKVLMCLTGTNINTDLKVRDNVVRQMGRVEVVLVRVS